MELEVKDGRNKRSDYYYGLDTVSKGRYDAKLQRMGLIYDPYVLGKKYFTFTNQINVWPEITYANLYNCLIDFPSCYTKQSLKSYKALESYKYVTAGLVSEVYCKSLRANNESDPTFLLMAKIRHGQSMFTKTPSRTWISCTGLSEICLGHCTCMAGLGETCSHVGVLLFYFYSCFYSCQSLGEWCTFYCMCTNT